ncbi:MAG: hypothetical protein HOE90_01605 [Bacteriovoracaceae bacterium]|jgi:hypothetical protein|nr:hypothetical protein [Bacteriovoracaceae bacterium]
MKNQTKIDWVGQWFPIMERNGEYTHIPFGSYDPNSNTVEFHHMPHKDFDGIGAFATLIGQNQNLPTLSEDHKPSIFRLLLGFISYFLESGVASVNWKNRDTTKLGAKIDPHYFVLSNSETSHLLERSKKNEVSVNSYLVHKINSAINQKLINGTKENLWLLPINMRGPITRDSPVKNHASYISLKIAHGEKVQSIQSKIKTKIKIGYHWASWWGVMLGKKIGIAGMEKILNKYHQKNHSWVGTFSNLGVWNSLTDKRDWFFCPPVTKAHPIGIGTICFNARLSIALQVHPSITQNPNDINEILVLIKENILKQK